MKQLPTTITSTRLLAGSLHLLTLVAFDLPHLRAGQLILVRANDSLDPYLRRAHFPLPRLPITNNNSCSLLIPTTDPLTRKAISETADVIAPVGNGFALDASTRRLLLIGDEGYLAPLIALAHEATQRQIAVTLSAVQTADGRPQTAAVGGQPSADSLFEWLGTLLPLDVEFQLASDIPNDLLRWPDQICAAGSLAMYAQLRERITQVMPVVPSGFAQVIVAPPMACGFGACLACAVETTHGMRLACVDGPVFDLTELVL